MHLLPRVTALCYGAFDLEAQGMNVDDPGDEVPEIQNEDEEDDEVELTEEETKEFLKVSEEKTQHAIYAYVAVPAYQKDRITVKTIVEEPDIVASLHATACEFQKEAMKQKCALFAPLKRRLEYRFRRFAHAVTYG